MARTKHLAVVFRLLRGDLRDLVQTPVVLIALAGCLVLSALSIYTLHLLALQIIQTTDSQFGQRGYDFVIPLPNRTEDDYFELRERWFELDDRPDYTLIPVIEGTIQYKGRPLPLLGIDLITSVPSSANAATTYSANVGFLNGATLVAFGTNLTAGEALAGRVVSHVYSSMQDYVLADISAAQIILSRRGQIDAVWLRSTAPPKTGYDWLIPGLLESSPSSRYESVLSEFGVQPFSRWNPVREFNRAIAFQLSILALLALAVATFVIFQITNTAAFRRRTEQSRLHALGVSAIHRITTLLICFALVGLFSSVVGIALGHLLLMYVIPENATLLGTDATLIAGLKAVVIVTCSNLVVVWWVYGLQRISIPTWLKWVVGSLASIGAIALLQFDASLLGAETAIVLACIAHVTLVVPAALYLLTRYLQQTSVQSHIKQMNRRAFANMLHVTRPIVFALSFALANAIGIDLMVASFKSNFLHMLDLRLVPAVYIANSGDLDLERLKDLEGVEHLRSYSTGKALAAQGTVNFTIAKLDPWEQSRYGYEASDAPAVFINEKAARAFSLDVGDTLTLQFQSEQVVQHPVNHIFRDYGTASPSVVLAETLVEPALFPQDRVLLLGNTDLIYASAKELQHQFPALSIRKNTEIREIAEYVFDQTFFLTRIMTFIALAVAVFGLACSLTVLLATRNIELRLLLTLGIAKSNLLKTNMIHSIGLGLATVIVALPLSMVIAVLLCDVVHPRAFGWTIDLQLLPGSLLYPALFCLLASLLAGFEPMRKTLHKIIGQPLSNVN